MKYSLYLLVPLLCFGGGFWLGGDLKLELFSRMTTLEADEGQQIAELSTLRQQLADAQLSGTIDHQVEQGLRDEIVAVREQNHRLQSDLAMYRQLMVPEKSEDGVQIGRMQLEVADESMRTWRYDLLLIQAVKDEIMNKRRIVRGSMSMALTGWFLSEETEQLNGESAESELTSEPSAIPFAELSHRFRGESAPAEFQFGFRFFQDFSGEFQLPANFVPKAIEVSADSGNGSVTRVFEWAALAGNSATETTGVDSPTGHVADQAP